MEMCIRDRFCSFEHCSYGHYHFVTSETAEDFFCGMLSRILFERSFQNFVFVA